MHHYLHEDPEEQGSHPDLNGQLPHGAAGVAPAAAAGAVRGSHGSARTALRSLGEGGALQAAGGGGRRARGGGGREDLVPASRSGLPDTQTPHRPLQVPLPITPIARQGLPAHLRSVLFLCPGLAPGAQDLGGEAWGCPAVVAAASLPARCAASWLLGGPWALRPPGSTLLRRPRRASSPAGDSCSGSLLFLHTPARGQEIDGRFGESLALRTALTSSGSTWECFFLPATCSPYTLPTSDSFFSNP